MENLIEIFMLLADVISGYVNALFTASAAWLSNPATVGGALSLAFATVAVTYSDIPAEVLAFARRWHGSIDEQYGNIDNLVVIIQAHPTTWDPPASFAQIVANRTQLTSLIAKCRSPQGSAFDRTQRNILLKTTVGLCLTQVKVWAYTQYYANIMTLADVHSLGFLLPGEAGGRHDRREATDVTAEVKVSIVSADIIRVVIDQASGENAALTVHGWPPGVKMALIVIIAADGATEVLRRHTTHLYNDIEMPAGSHGKQFIIKASFLRHIDDEPRFGPQPTFSMPLTTEDLAAALDRRHHEEFEAYLREVEQHRREVEQLTASKPAAGDGDSGQQGKQTGPNK
jgi:hypothetical protein